MTSPDEHKKLLSETALLAGISDQTLGRIAATAQEQSCATDEPLYQLGDDALDFFVLVSGSVRFILEDRASTLSTGIVMRQRMVFGWAALVPEHPRRLGSAQCLEPSSLLVMNGDKVLEILRNEPASGFIIMERLCAMIARNFMEQRN